AAAALAGDTISHNPGLKSSFAVARKIQPRLLKGACLVGVPHPTTLLEPIIKTACGRLPGSAFWPASDACYGRQFPTCRYESKTLAHTENLAGSPLRGILREKRLLHLAGL